MYDINEVRIKATALAQRLESDTEFRAQVQSDPVGTLQAAGLPEQLVGDFLRDVNMTADVTGYEFGVECTETTIIIIIIQD